MFICVASILSFNPQALLPPKSTTAPMPLCAHVHVCIYVLQPKLPLPPFIMALIQGHWTAY